MNKALVVGIRSKWLEMILNGKKTFEFRNWKVPVGTVIYFYCTKAIPYLINDNQRWNGDEIVYSDNFTLAHNFYSLSDLRNVDVKIFNGQVVAKAVVKEVYEIEKWGDFASNSIHEKYYWNKKGFEFGEIWETHYLDLSNDEAIDKHLKNIGYTDQRYALELTDIEAIEPREITTFKKWNKGDKWHPDMNWIRLTHAPQSRVWVLEEEVK